MGVDQTESLPAELLQGLEPLLKEVVSLTEKIKELDRRVEQIAREDWDQLRFAVSPLHCSIFSTRHDVVPAA